MDRMEIDYSGSQDAEFEAQFTGDLINAMD